MEKSLFLYIYITLLLSLLPCCGKAKCINENFFSHDSVTIIEKFLNTGETYPDKPDIPIPEPLDPTFKNPEKVWVHDDFCLYTEKPYLETAKKKSSQKFSD